VKVKLKLILYL